MSFEQAIMNVLVEYTQKAKPTSKNQAMACCPFHRKLDGSIESNPSFSMHLSMGLFQCYTCHAKGNLRTFFKKLNVPRDIVLLKYQNLIEQSSQRIAEFYQGKVFGNPNVYNEKRIYTHQVVSEQILGLFDYIPIKLLESGFTKETLTYFDVGIDPINLRITFPIRDLLGNLVAISGRQIYTEDMYGRKIKSPRYKIYKNEYKYWNLPPVLEWNKGSVLYNAHNVLHQVIDKRPNDATVIIVEGFKACMWLHQLGFKNVVALMGSKLTYDQKCILNIFGCKLLLLLDNNEAGRAGAFDAAVQLERSQHVRLAVYPDRLIFENDAQPDQLTKQEVLYMLGNPLTLNRWKRIRKGKYEQLKQRK